LAKDDLLEILNLTAEISELKAVRKGRGAGAPDPSPFVSFYDFFLCIYDIYAYII
jgi:hypothetical protein